MFKTVNDGRLPERSTTYSAAFDVFCNDFVVINEGETKLIPLGICLNIEEFVRAYDVEFCPVNSFRETHYFELHPRSSIRAKGLGGGVGIIDIDYTDEIKMVMTNPINNTTNALKSILIDRGDKIGQLILKRHEGRLLPESYTKNEKRVGGFGSSGLL